LIFIILFFEAFLKASRFSANNLSILFESNSAAFLPRPLAGFVNVLVSFSGCDDGGSNIKRLASLGDLRVAPFTTARTFIF